MEEKQVQKPHKLVVNNRKTSMVTGVLDVLSFDLNEILLETEQGMLMVKGKDLHVNRLSVEKGEVDLSGHIDSIAYSDVVLLVYTCIRVFRRLIKHDLFFVSLEDFFFWVWAGLYLFVKIYDTSDGSIRWFFTIGVVVGGVCSFFVLHFLSEMGKKLVARIREKDEKSIDKSKEKR